MKGNPGVAELPLSPATPLFVQQIVQTNNNGKYIKAAYYWPFVHQWIPLVKGK